MPSPDNCPVRMKNVELSIYVYGTVNAYTSDHLVLDEHYCMVH